MKRDWHYMDRYLDELSDDVYSQPPDDGHTAAAKWVIDNWIFGLGCGNVLDVGCGSTAFCRDFFMQYGLDYTGIALGDDATAPYILNMDMSFLWFDDNAFDLIWCRHVLEHSPFPLLTLMEFHRVSSKWLCLVLPNPDYYKYNGRNHYSVMEAHQAVWLLRRAGWELDKIELTGLELRFLCRKKERISYEGYTEAPISSKLYEFERDKLRIGTRMDVTEYMRPKEDGIF